MPAKAKSTIVFCHGIWADGSCFSKVIPALQAYGHEVIVVQYGLDSLAKPASRATATPEHGRGREFAQDNRDMIADGLL